MCNFIGNSQVFSQENVFDNVVCKILAILFRPPFVNSLVPGDTIWRQEIWVNYGSGNGLLLDGTKPLPEPMLTYEHEAKVLWHSSEGIIMRRTEDTYK